MISDDDKTRNPSVCIIGAGITGLTAARQLAALGYDVLVLESALNSGGMLSAFNIGDELIEHIYHHIFTSDSEVLGLIDELGLSADMKWYMVKDALFAGGRNYPFSTPLDLLRFHELPLLQRLRTGLTVLKAGRLRDWHELESITAAQWLIDNCGQDAYDKLWKPLLRAKFDQDAEEVSAVWIWNKFKLRGSSRSGGKSIEKLGYLDGSFAKLTEVLLRELDNRGGRILYGYTAMGLTRFTAKNGNRRYRVSSILEDCSSIDFDADAVISTISTRQFANLAISLSLPEDYREKLLSVRYKANICMVLRLRRSLSTWYWNTICDQLPFVVAVEHTNMTGINGYGGHIVYLSRYLDITDEVWTRSDGEIYQSFIAGLEHIYPDFSANDIIDWRLKRSRYAQPVVFRNYSSFMPEMNTPEPGIKLAGMAQIYPEDRGINYAVRLGREAADSIVDYIRGSGQF
ncbi:MAG: NAD(P)/FAD-dependent oxidoreductase [Clostridiaceae bacterium]|nr:NAD(P)/FAD-dependent oxidoreductase [Clostridiaceae bacterium]